MSANFDLRVAVEREESPVSNPSRSQNRPLHGLLYYHHRDAGYNDGLFGNRGSCVGEEDEIDR